MKNEWNDKIAKESPLVNETLKTQLKNIFDKLDRPVRLVSVIDETNPACMEMGAFLRAVSSVSPLIELEFLEKGERPEIEQELNAEYLPVVGLYGETYLGVAFHGIPGGQEINSFVLAIYNAGSPGQAVEEKVLKKIGKLKKQNHLKVCVSLSCHHCPKVVTAGQRIALLSPNVTCEMIDARLYPELTEKYQITRVPAIILNDQALYLGEKDMEELLALLR